MPTRRPAPRGQGAAGHIEQELEQAGEWQKQVAQALRLIYNQGRRIEGKVGKLMATVEELQASVDALAAKLVEVSTMAKAEFDKLEAELTTQGIDPALLDPLKAQIDALAQAAADSEAQIPTN